MKSRLEELVEYVLSEGSPDETLRPKEMLEKEASTFDINRYRVLHEDDLELWHLLFDSHWKGVDRFLAKINGSSNESYQRFSPETMEGEPSESDVGRLNFMSKLFRPIACNKHQRPVSVAFGRTSATGTKRPRVLSERVCLLEVNQYNQLLGIFAAIASTLYPSFDEPLPLDLCPSAADEVGNGLDFVRKWGIDCHHPVLRRARQQSDAKEERFSISSNSLSMIFETACEFCEDDECCKVFQDWQAQADSSRPKPSKSADPTKAYRAKIHNASGTAAHDAIPLESDLEDDPAADKFSLRVFEMEQDSDEESALNSLVQCSGLSAGDADVNGGPRRSSRKRTSRYPVGPIKGENSVRIAMHHNIAALRLVLFEKAESFRLGHSLKLVISAGYSKEKPDSVDAKEQPRPGNAKDDTEVDHTNDNLPQIVDLSGDTSANPSSAVPCFDDTPASTDNGIDSAKDDSPTVVDLSFDLIDKTLLEVCESAIGTKLAMAFNPVDDLAILHDPKDETDLDDSIMDTLFQVSNMSDTAKDTATGTDTLTVTKKSGRRAATERGFTGTFLSSGPKPVPKKDKEANASSHETSPHAETGESTEPLSKRAKVNGSKDTREEPQPKVNGALDTRSQVERSIDALLPDESDDDDVVLSGGLTPQSSPKRLASNGVGGKRYSECRDGSHEKRVLELVKLLELVEPNEEIDFTEAWEAAKWACHTFPDEDKAENLVIMAYEYVLSCQDANEKKEKVEASPKANGTAVGPNHGLADKLVVTAYNYLVSPKEAKENEGKVEVSPKANGTVVGPTHVHDMHMQLVDLLKELNPGHEMIESICWEAAEWAARTHPDEMEAKKLVDAAYVKYLELTISFD